MRDATTPRMHPISIECGEAGACNDIGLKKTKNGKVKGTIAVLLASIIARKVIIALVFSFALLTAIVSVNAAVPTLAPPLDFDKFTPEEITFDKSGESWVLTDGEGDIIGIEISGYMESIALLKKRFAVDTSKPLTIEYKIRFNFRDSSSDATVNIFLDPPSEEDWWNDPIGVGHNGEINGDVLNFLHSFGPGDSPYGNWGGKVGVCDDVEGGGGDLPYRSAPYPKDGEWVTVRVLVSETGFEVVSVGEEGYYRKESCAYDLSDVEYIGVGFGDQCMSKVEVDYIKATPTPTTPNLLKNPGFESGERNPWYSTKYSDPYEKCEWIDIDVDTEARFEGEYGAFIDIQCSREAWGRIIQEPIEITPGEKLDVEAKLMYEEDLNDGFAELCLVFLDEEQKYVESVYRNYYKSDFGAEDNWINTVLPTAIAPSNVKYVRLMVGLANVKSCRLNIDNVILKYASAIENHPPTAIRIEPVPKEVYIDAGDTITFKVNAEDEDEDEHNDLYRIEWFVNNELKETDPADETSKEASFIYTFENRGMFSVKATVYDERMEEDSVTWEVNVGEDVGLKEEEILDNDGNEIGLKVRIEYPTSLHLGNRGYIDIKLETKEFGSATYPLWDTNLRSGTIVIASDEDMFVEGGEVLEITPVPQLLHREAFGWKDYKKYLRQEKNEWGMHALKRIFAGLPYSSQMTWLEETLNWNPFEDIKYDIGRGPTHIAFNSKNNYDIWEYPWTFDLFSISKFSAERWGHGVHLRMPFVYAEAGKHEILVFLYIEDYNGYGFQISGITIGKEYKCDITVT